MMKFIEMDANVPMSAQMQESGGPVILVNKFHVADAAVERFLQTWGEDAAFMKRQPGFISTQLHRGIGGSGVFLNYAVWESVEVFRAAFSQPEFQEALSKYPENIEASPHLFQKIAVPGICTG